MIYRVLLPGELQPLCHQLYHLSMHASPVSDPMVIGIPNQGMISFRRSQATSGAFSAQGGKASTQPENVHTKTSRHL